MALVGVFLTPGLAAWGWTAVGVAGDALRGVLMASCAEILRLVADRITRH